MLLSGYDHFVWLQSTCTGFGYVLKFFIKCWTIATAGMSYFLGMYQLKQKQLCTLSYAQA